MAEAATEPARSCHTCHKLESELGEKLKNCVKCPGTLYCNRECQKADWKQHKLFCGRSDLPPSAHNPGFHAINALLGYDDDTYLHGLSEEDAFGRLIDCFCMRVEDEYTWGGNTIGLYNGDNPLPDFRHFLSLAESRPKLLPPWWNKQKRKQCERLAVSKDRWTSINYAIEKHDVMEHYNNNLMPMELRVLGEKIYGQGFM